MNPESFSVLISVYYKENPIFLHQALNSIFNQTCLPSEIVLIKDGPLTVELENVIDTYKKKYPIFVLLQNETNIGLGLSLAKGLLACSNEIVARMDSDDISHPERFEKQLIAIEKGYDVVSCWSTLFVDSINNIIALKKRPEFHDDIVKLCKRRSPVSHSACIYRKSKVIAAGSYLHCELYEDYHLWVRMIMNGAKFYNVQESLFFVRTSLDQASRRGGWKYLKNEVKTFLYFHQIGFFSNCDLFINIIIRTPIRLLPAKLRYTLLKKIWNR
ncbi:MAG TPA: amylovoran biosynthesis protein AmsE [Porphyromonadaceae bacterium]|jgi:glycosyltransferase involved in cell wall biosynthesis|nr:amylovoran biosynthesis protein AmsE [Porphyromonadaceae bacterium]HCM19287.1 amylovoran biosynthesis protein AmsE [Porphyromonadaceae bacterium]